MRTTRLVLILMAVVAVTGCGKTLDQVKQVAHDLIDVAGKTYEDVKDNLETAKKIVTPESPAK